MQVDRRRRQIPPRRPRAVSFSVGDISLWFSQSLKYLTNRWREAVDTGRKPRQKAGFSQKKTALPRRLTNSRRPTNQRPVKSRRRVRKPFARLKYRNILYLILGAIAISLYRGASQ